MISDDFICNQNSVFRPPRVRLPYVSPQKYPPQNYHRKTTTAKLRAGISLILMRTSGGKFVGGLHAHFQAGQAHRRIGKSWAAAVVPAGRRTLGLAWSPGSFGADDGSRLQMRAAKTLHERSRPAKGTDVQNSGYLHCSPPREQFAAPVEVLSCHPWPARSFGLARPDVRFPLFRILVRWRGIGLGLTHPNSTEVRPRARTSGWSSAIDLGPQNVSRL